MCDREVFSCDRKVFSICCVLFSDACLVSSRAGYVRWIVRQFGDDMGGMEDFFDVDLLLRAWEMLIMSDRGVSSSAYTMEKRYGLVFVSNSLRQ